ncbi:hypothetical protein [Aerosakkonema funiforme]|uniref:hypothetical protein n=1 Tax=Aerosakkonema funiforme TaxID=1246630 RepID=UPI0035B9AF4A
MPSQPDRQIRLEMMLSSSQPTLLEGLDIWLRLGLISDAQVRQLCQKYLSCPLPQPIETLEVPATTVPAQSKPPLTPVNEPQLPKRRKRIFQSLLAELSVRWFLFLGVFMVVLSSGVLAASQWQRFPAFGQYAVLLGYTLIFWGASFWTARQKNLQLTAQTLQLVTLFLVPVNFWAMDGFRLWGNPTEWVTVGIASLTLTGITAFILKNQPRNLEYSVPINYLGLCYLHWGWEFSGFPLLAVYLGIVGTVVFLIWRFCVAKLRSRNTSEKGEIETGENGNTDTGAEANIDLLLSYLQSVGETPGEDNLSGLPNDLLSNGWPIASSQPPATDRRQGKVGIVVYALAVLLVRAIFSNYVEIGQLGLAVGICGWLLAWLSLQRPSPLNFSSAFSQSNWEAIGAILLLVGWVVSVGVDPAWQAIGVSGLGLWFFWSRLQRFWLWVDFSAMLGIGLQAIWLFWRLIPPENQDRLISTAIELSNAQENPYPLLSLVLFPYAIWIVILTDWLWRRSKSELAEFGETIAFSFGLITTCISLVNPLLRSLNLLAVTINLAIVNWRHPRSTLVYLTHISIILSLVSALDYLLPNFSLENWATVLLGLTIAEWLLSLKGLRDRVPQIQTPIPETESSLLYKNPNPQSKTTSRSAWYIGLSLAALSYILFVVDFSSTSILRLSWLLVPLTLTLVANRSETSQRSLASWLSLIAFGMAQILTVYIPDARLVGLGIASMAMLVNSRYLRHLAATLVTVGFTISFLGFSLWEGFPGFPPLSVDGWFLVSAIAINILWWLRSWLLERSVKAVQAAAEGVGEKSSPSLYIIYARAVDLWAIALCSQELVVLTFRSVGIYSDIFTAALTYLATAVLLMGANFYRCLPHPRNLCVYAIGWGFELFVAESVKLGGGSYLDLAIANIAIALVGFILALWSIERYPSAPSSIRILPLIYAFLGLALRGSTFNSWTGVLLFGASIVGLGIGGKSPAWKALQYLALTGISLSVYELVIYQMRLSGGGNLADGLTVLAVVGAAIAFIYRLLARWLQPLLRLSLAEIINTAHIHWALGSTLMFAVASIGVGTGPQLTVIGVAVSLLLAAYAIAQGRYEFSRFNPSEWVYLGLIEVAGVYAYGRLFWTELSVLDPWLAALVCVIALIMYNAPWQNWGWPATAWKNSMAILPGFTVLATSLVIDRITLIVVAIVYLLLAKLAQNVRLTYVSIIIVEWVTYRWFWQEMQLTNISNHILWYVIPVALAVLYLAQVDPGLKQPEQKQIRHILRLLGIGSICGVSLWTEHWTGLVSGMISCSAIFVGLALRIRAFLFIGTVTFLINASFQLVILNDRYSFLKWAIGLVVGIGFMLLAANFETRRSQIASLVRNSLSELQNWE